jgi:eukaryotic-like serine/threonine-protein kinase
MSFAAGARLGPYEVLSPLGAGGMGEVYRARDTKLGREVAVKVLPDAFVSDPERLARLEREARLLASLNHPNIATLYAFENEQGIRFLVMEVVEGPTLGERLGEGPLPVRDALEFFRQVADGLAAAHRKGVVHRDLKPGNLKIAPGGLAKILDFGLATTIVPGVAGDVTNSPTASVSHTATGVIQGTAPYMAPEQAKGKQADERSDVFAFGVTLYEALAGRRAFAGDSVTEVLAAVLEREPDLAVLPPETPDLVRFLLRRCLKKNPDERLRDVAEAKAVLAEALSAGAEPPAVRATPTAAPGRRSPRRLAQGLGALALVAAGAVAGRHLWRRPDAAVPAPVRRFQIDDAAGGAPRVSPDGKHIVYADGERLRIRDLDRLESRAIPGSERSGEPFWAPDGQSVAFFAGGLLKRAPVEGGIARAICEIKPAGLVLGGTWSSSGSIVVALGPALGLYEVSADGGELRPLLKPDPAKGIFDFHAPRFLPDGRSLLLIVHPQTGFQFYLAVFDGKEVRRLLPESTPPVDNAAYSRSGYVLFQRQEDRSSLLAVPFDASRLAVRGEPVHLAEDAGDPSVSSDGVLVYRTGGPLASDLVLVDRSGAIQRTISPGHQIARFPRVSPDGKRILITESKGGNQDAWVEDIERGTRVRLTSGPETDVAGSWSASGERVAIMSGLLTDSVVVLLPSDGSGHAERLPFRANTLPEANDVSVDWSPDGRYVIYRSMGDLWVGDVTGTSAPVAFAQTPFTETEGRFSPDGRYVAYMSNESGRFEVYVRPFPAGDRKWTLSTNGGAAPRWSRRGDELFYVEGTTVMSVAVSTRDGFRSSPPRKLFDAAAIGATATASFSSMIATYDPMPDGLGFAIIRNPPARERKLVVVENWAEELKKRP